MKMNSRRYPFDDFKKDTSEYSFDLTDIVTQMNSGSIKLLVSPQNRSLRWSLSLTALDDKNSEPIRKKENWYFYSDEYDVALNFEFESLDIMGGALGTAVNLFHNLNAGRYSIKLNVHEAGKPESGDMYEFTFAVLPSISYFSTSAGGKQLAINPAFTNNSWINGEDSLVDKYTITTGTKELLLAGSLRTEGSTLLLNNVDKTSEFTGSGVSLSLRSPVNTRISITSATSSILRVL